MLMETEKKDNFRIYHITLAIMTILIIVLGVADLFLALNPRKTSGGEGGGTSGISDDNDGNQGKKSYMDLTKEEAIAAFKKMQEPGYLPEGYISEAVIPPVSCRTMNDLTESYETKEDINRIYEDYPMTNMAQFGSVQFVNDYYAVIFSSTYEYGAEYSETGVATGCLRLFSFNEKYYDYFSEEFIDTSPSFIKVALPVLATSSGEIARLDTIYSHDFDEDENGITLNIHMAGLGYDTDYSDLETYEKQRKAGTLSRALVFETMKYRYDKSSNTANLVTECEGCTFGIKVNRTIPLSDEEVKSLFSK